MTFFSALILGLLASAHCAGMCGGLQMALQPTQTVVIRSQREAFWHLLALNAGRLSTYIIAGTLLGLVNLHVIQTINIPALAHLTRVFAALILVLIGVQLLIANSQPLAGLEPYGSMLWKRLQGFLPNLQQYGHKKLMSYYCGLIWGCLPCGLLYGVLLATILTNTPWQGGMTLFGFGIGTLPAMLLTGSLYQQFRYIIWSRAMQSVGGLLFVVGGGLMLASPWLISTDFIQAYPILLNTVFCLV